MRRILPTTLLMLALLPVCGMAQSEPRGDQAIQRPPVEKRPWVGVSVSPASAALRHQLKVTDGVGLIVEFVQPGSPASDARIRPFDLLLKLDDQWLINPEQFAVLIRMHHSGDDVKLTLLREAGEQTITVKLAEHEFSAIPDWDGTVAWPTVPHDGAAQPQPGNRGAERMLTWLDGRRQVNVTTGGGHSNLTVRDNASGRVLFDGPIDTPEQRKSVPEDVHGVLDSLSKISAAFGDPHSAKHDPAADLNSR